MRPRWFAIFVCLAFSILEANAIKCYECRSDNGQCTTGSCESSGGVCTKREKNYGNGTWTVIKNCRTAPVVNKTCEYDQTIALGGQICFCDAFDYCNDASRVLSTNSIVNVLITSILSAAMGIIRGGL